MQQLLEIKEITFSYMPDDGKRESCVFNRFSAQFPVGEWSAVMAESGKGKTTLLKLIAGLLPLSSGHILYPMEQPRFSFVFQEDRLLEYESAAKNLRFVNPKLSDAQIREALRQINFPVEYTNQKVRKLSGGEKRRIAILRALFAEYDILLLDEPFTGMDNKTKRMLISYMKKQTDQKTVLLITHDKEDVQLSECSTLIQLS